MPVTGSLLTSGTGATSASITPGANRLIIASFSAAGPVAQGSSLSGCGLTWTNIFAVSKGGSNQFHYVYKAIGSSPSTGTLSFGANGATVFLHTVCEFADCDELINTGTFGWGTYGGSPVTSITLGSFSSANNGTFHTPLISGSSQDITAVGSGFTQLSDGDNSYHSLLAQWKNSNDTTCDFSYGGFFIEGAGIAGELRYVAPAAGGALRRVHARTAAILAM